MMDVFSKVNEVSCLKTSDRHVTTETLSNALLREIIV